MEAMRPIVAVLKFKIDNRSSRIRVEFDEFYRAFPGRCKRALFLGLGPGNQHEAADQ